jgi:ethanolamine utilization cobalamin adenosyltransferase
MAPRNALLTNFTFREETEKMTVYAEEDRKAAREELTRVQEAYKACVEGPDQELAEEVKRRIGQRMRELEQGVNAMEELAMNQD